MIELGRYGPFRWVVLMFSLSIHGDSWTNLLPTDPKIENPSCFWTSRTSFLNVSSI
jgi:hypothetical protein